MARGRGEVSGFTVPAVNIRASRPSTWPGRSTSGARADVGAVIFELARSEQTYTFQRPIDYATSRPRGRDRGGLVGPGVHPGRPLPVQREEVRRRPRGDDRGDPARVPLAIDAGYRNIDIDTSTLVDLVEAHLDEQQRENYVRAAELTALIRELEPDGVTVSVGGEIGEVGKENSTVDELAPTWTATCASSRRRAPGAKGLSKVQRPDRHRARRRAAARRGRGRGQARLRRAARARRGRPLVRAGRRRAARRLDAARGAVPPLPGRRDRRDPPRDRLPERALRPPGLPGRAEGRDPRRGCARTPRTSARTARPRSSSCTRRARRRSGRSSASCGSWRRRTRSSPRRRRKLVVPVHGAPGERHRSSSSSATSSRCRSRGRSPRRCARRPRR